MATDMHSIPDATLTSAQSPEASLGEGWTPEVYAQQSNASGSFGGELDFARSSGTAAKRRGQAGSDCAAKACGARAKPVACRDPSGKPPARRLSPIRTRAHAKLRRRPSVDPRSHAEPSAHGPDRDQSRRAAKDGDAVIRAHGFEHERNNASCPGQFANDARSPERSASDVRNDDGANRRAEALDGRH